MEIKHTQEQYRAALQECSDLFFKKYQDYGTSWRILRPSSLTDQLYIKARRIRSLEENELQKVDEGVDSEYRGLVNYSILALVQLEKSGYEMESLSLEETKDLYNRHAAHAEALMLKKNHDYGEAWKHMRLSSITDLILMKLLRIKQIENNSGRTMVSEGLEANYLDIINYSLFALILLSEKEA